MLQLIVNALSRLSPASIGKVASKLSAYLGRGVEASKSGIIDTFKSLASNPLAQYGAFAAISDLIDFDFDLFELDVADQDNPALSLILEEVRQKRMKLRDQVTGDGNPDTVFGEDNDNVVTTAAGVMEAVAIRTEAIRAAGGKRALEALIAGVFQDRKAAAIADQMIEQQS